MCVSHLLSQTSERLRLSSQPATESCPLPLGEKSPLRVWEDACEVRNPWEMNPSSLKYGLISKSITTKSTKWNYEKTQAWLSFLCSQSGQALLQVERTSWRHHHSSTFFNERMVVTWRRQPAVQNPRSPPSAYSAPEGEEREAFCPQPPEPMRVWSLRSWRPGAMGTHRSDSILKFGRYREGRCPGASVYQDWERPAPPLSESRHSKPIGSICHL